VVCPNCGDELAVGKDEMKQQIWVVKSCGHVSVFQMPILVLRTSKLINF
jgi:ribosomal protein L37AE/L43A